MHKYANDAFLRPYFKHPKSFIRLFLLKDIEVGERLMVGGCRVTEKLLEKLSTVTEWAAAVQEQ